MGKLYIEIEIGDSGLRTISSVLDLDRVLNALHAYLVDSDLSKIGF
jgi:hypothetical protein